MRVAFSGSHRVGKTTLIEAVSARLPRYQVLEEPYAVLEEEGYEFSDPPVVEDFERQLEQSIESIAETGKDALIDRCPLDFVAYLRALDHEIDVDEIRDAMEAIDLVVVVPIETRIVVAAHEDRRLRQQVDEIIRAIVVELEVPVIEVTGSVEERLRQVMAAIR